MRKRVRRPPTDRVSLGGNPNFYKGMPSLNPGGQPKAAPGFRDGCRRVMLDKGGLEQMEAMAMNRKPQTAEEYADRRWALGKLMDYGFDKPLQPQAAAVAVAHQHRVVIVKE
jgi:hypothetical protein